MKNKWTAEKIQDQSGKTILITGANSGVGFEAAKELSAKGAEIIMAVRSPEKGEQARQKIHSLYPDAKLELMTLDLSDLSSIKSFADSFKNRYSKLDVLLNNAGVMIPPYTKTKDGFELQFGVNHLGHFALTAQIFNTLKNTENSRIINVSSIAHKQGKIFFNDLNWEKSYNKIKAYGQSKLANLLFTYELARKIEARKLSVKSVAAHPGVSNTNLMRNINFGKKLMLLITQPAEKGALPLLYAACDPNMQNADYAGPKGFMEMKGYPAKVKSNKASHNKETAEKLWAVSEELTGLKFEL